MTAGTGWRKATLEHLPLQHPSNQDNLTYPNICKSELFDFPPITPAQVVLYFKDIPVRKAIESYHLSVRILRLQMPFIITSFTDIINQAISSDTFPSQWKTAFVTSLNKNGNKKKFLTTAPFLSYQYSPKFMRTTCSTISISSYLATT